MSPTQRSLAHLRSLGYTAAVVERWNSFVRRRQDLFGFIDIVAVRAGESGVLAVQATVAGSMAARRTKIDAEPRADEWLDRTGNRIVVHGWRKGGARGKRKTWILVEDVRTGKASTSPDAPTNWARKIEI